MDVKLQMKTDVHFDAAYKCGPNKLKVYEGESCDKYGSTKEVETTLFMRICKNIQRPSNKLNVFHNHHLFQ